MAEQSVREFDAVIVGAGHNSLVLGNYLARCGLSVVLLERKLEAGGGLISEELTVPGYWNNTVSYTFDQLSIEPAYRDLLLDQFNVQYLLPEIQATLLLRDARELSLYSDLEATCRSISPFSERDARTYREVVTEFERFARERLAPRLRALPTNGLISAEDGPFHSLAQQTPRQVVEAWFESEPLRALILTLLPLQRGVAHDYAGMGWTVPLLLDQLRHTSIVAGGTHVLAQALLRALVRAGGTYHVLKQVSRVLVEGGSAVGVELADGTVYRARQLVASGVDVWQTVLDLLPRETVDPTLEREVRAFQADEFALYQVHLSLAEAPRYAAGAHPAEADRALRVVIGPETADDVAGLWDHLRAGHLPDRPAMVCSTPTVLDPRQAPRGRHTAFLNQFVPYQFDGRAPQAWQEVREPYLERCLSWWRAKAPNLAGPTIEWQAPLTPWEQAARMTSMVRGGLFVGRNTADQIGSHRPAPTLSGFRTPVGCFYLCGASSHPGLGILGGAGYAAANVIADDLGLDKWWKR